MKKPFWYTMIINLMIVLTFAAPVQASVIITTLETQAVMDDLLSLAKNRQYDVGNSEIDPIKARLEAKAAKSQLLKEIDEDLAHVQDPTISLQKIRAVYTAKVIFNGNQKISNLKKFINTLSDKDIDAIAVNATSAEEVYKKRLFKNYSSLVTRDQKTTLVGKVLHMEFKGQQSRALEKIKTMSREDFINELQQSREIINSKDFESIWLLLGVLLLVALVVAVGSGTGYADDGGYYDDPGDTGGSCTYGSRGSFWKQVNTFEEYNCGGYDSWGNEICRWYTCYRSQRFDTCTGQPVSPSDYKTDCY